MFNHVARLAQALASPVRVEIVDLLVQCPRSVDTLASELEQSLANASQHLQVMKAAGLVLARRDGNRADYSLADDIVLALYAELSLAVDRLSDHAKATRAAHYSGADREPAVSVDELPAWLEREQAILVDVRPEAEYCHAHLPGAVNCPIADLRSGLLPAFGQPAMLTYCRGPHCTYSFEAVGRLREYGIKARRLDGGFLGWRLSQLQH